MILEPEKSACQSLSLHRVCERETALKKCFEELLLPAVFKRKYLVDRQSAIYFQTRTVQKLAEMKIEIVHKKFVVNDQIQTTRLTAKKII